MSAWRRALGCGALGTLALVAACQAPRRDPAPVESTTGAATEQAAPAAPALPAGAGEAPVVSSDAALRVLAGERVAVLAAIREGTHGMFAETRWTMSPDGSTLIAVEDPAAVEAEPVADGAVIASETLGGMWRLGSLWDVAPSPDWTRVAYAWAYRLPGGEGDTLPDAAWARGARDLDLPLDSVRAVAFDASGMAIIKAVGFTHVLPLSALRPGVPVSRPRARDAVAPYGWQLRWTRDGGMLGIATAPRGAQELSPVAAWRMARPSSRGLTAARADTTSFARVRWTAGPVLDVSVRLDSLRAASRVRTASGSHRFEERDGWIRRVDARGVARVIGRGIPVVTTANGTFVVAIAPRTDAKEYETPTQLVVYQILP